MCRRPLLSDSNTYASSLMSCSSPGCKAGMLACTISQRCLPPCCIMCHGLLPDTGKAMEAAKSLSLWWTDSPWISGLSYEMYCTRSVQHSFTTSMPSSHGSHYHVCLPTSALCWETAAVLPQQHLHHRQRTSALDAV